MRKEFPTSDDLLHFVHVASSHDDFEIVEDLYGGFDRDLNLTFVRDHHDYSGEGPSYSSYVSVSRDEVYDLARALNSSLSHLPYAISADVARWQQSNFLMPSKVRECFSEIIDLLKAKGCHPQMYRRIQRKDDTD